MAENNEPATPEPSGFRMPPALPRRNLSAERQAQPAADNSDDALADFVDSVKVLAKRFTAEEPEPAEKERPGKRVKKFQRSGLSEERAALPASGTVGKETPPDAAAPGPSPEAEKADPAAFNKNVAWPRNSQGDTLEYEERPIVRPPRKKRKKALVLAVVQGTGFGLLLLGIWLGRQTVSPAANSEDTTPAAPARVRVPGDSFRISERALQAVNEALHAAHQGDIEEAGKRFNQLLTTNPDLPGVQYQLARLALQSGDLLAADLHLDRSSDAGESMAACCYARARFAAKQGNYAEVARQFQAAAHEEPFDGRSFFYWGEALRRQGQPLSAISALDQAIDRAHTPPDGLLYLFKEKLARVEVGNDEAFNTELNDHLKQSTVDGEWLLLAAARDILNSKFAAAADSLKKASTTLQPGEYDLLVKDYVFQIAANEPVLAALVQRPVIANSTEQNGPFLDPTVLSPAFADPAIWPVATAK